MSKQLEDDLSEFKRKKEAELDEVLVREKINLILRSVGEELNRPLALIDNNREYLQMHLNGQHKQFSKEKVNAALADISSATMHLNRLQENFVEMTACLHGTLSPVLGLIDLVAVLRGVCKDATEIYRLLGIDLVMDIGDFESAFVFGDRTYAERICLNLLSNALHACTAGEHVTFQLLPTKTGYVLSVKDDGYGFPPESVLSAFEPCQERGFLRPKGFERGGGMGLYLCGEYCRLMNWKISIALENPGTKVSLEMLRGEDVYCREVTLHTSEYEQEVQAQITRMEVLRELRAVPGLESLRR